MIEKAIVKMFKIGLKSLILECKILLFLLITYSNITCFIKSWYFKNNRT